MKTADELIDCWRDNREAAPSFIFDEAKKIVSGDVGLRNRFEVCLLRMRELPRREALKLMGLVWPFCWVISTYRRYLLDYLTDFENIDAMMIPAALEQLSGMPERFTVYRGCSKINQNGFSWSLRKEIAIAFAHQHQYRRIDQQPLLLTGIVRRDQVALILGRSEHEIVAANVGVLRVSELPATR